MLILCRVEGCLTKAYCGLQGRSQTFVTDEAKYAWAEIPLENVNI